MILIKYTNNTNVSLSLAVFLASSNYSNKEGIPSDLEHLNIISATTLLKPVRQTVLAQRVPQELAVLDVSQLMSSRMGSSIHSGIEQAWKNNYKRALADLGYSENVIDKVRINPPKNSQEDIIPVYMENREYKQLGNFCITGQYDFVMDGKLEDFKSTSTFTYMNNTKDEDYILQGSIYRWLNPDIIYQDTMTIQFIFTDWSAAKAKADPNYPQQKFISKSYPLLSLEETERYIKQRLKQLEEYWDKPEEEIPECTDKELWRSDPVWKYYKDPKKMTRSTKNFDNKQDAYIRLAEDGNVGTVVEVPGKAVACRYCSAYPICTQKDRLIASGDLEV